MSKQILQFLVDMLLPLVIGYFLKRSSKFPAQILDKLIVINIIAILPLLSLFSLWIVHLDPRYLWLPFLGMFQQIIPGFIGFFFHRKNTESIGERGSYVISGLLSNRTTMGTLSIFILLGEQAYALSQLAIIFEIVVIFALAFPMARYYQELINGEKGSKFSLKDLINRNMIPLIGMSIGLVLNFQGVPRPALAGNIFPYLIHLNGWSGLLPVGYSINFAVVRERLKRVWGIAGTRFLTTPLVTILLLLPLRHDMIVVKTVLVLSFAPTAIFSVLTAKLYKLDVDFAVAAFIVTTVIYLALIFPVIAVGFHLFS